VLRRYTATLSLAMATLTLAAPAERALGAGTTNFAYYDLINNRSTAVNDLIVTNVLPPNAIAPPNASTSPLTILDGSFGFDQKSLQVFLSPSDPNVQGLAIKFANGGLAPGGTLDFKVSLDPNVAGTSAPQLVLQAPDTDLKLVNMPPPSPPVVVTTPIVVTPVTAPSSTTAPSTPEPISLALWSTLAGCGLLRARAFRRAKGAGSARASA